MSKPRILITGGAGYIGSHAVIALRERDRDVVVLDNLSTGSTRVIPSGVPLVVGDVGDKALLDGIFDAYRISAVMHFAGSIVVPDSVRAPMDYYQNNTVNSLRLLQACVKHRVSSFVFSSTAAVYGIPEILPVSEDAPTRPINPYGRSKLMTEQMLVDASHAHRIRFACLRYFNVAGADPLGRSGQTNPRATQLIKVASQVALGVRPELEIYGSDFDTPDGTGIRDFIHVSDLADAHVAAVDYLERGGASVTLNCGYGHGSSVRQVVETIELLTGRRLPTRVRPRRAGDPPCVYAQTARIRSALNWSPKHDSLATILRTSLEWEQRMSVAQVAQKRAANDLLGHAV